MFLELSFEYDGEIPDYIGNKYDSKFEKMIEINITDNLMEKIKHKLKLAFCEYLITQSVGLVISGINTKDHFPSLISFNMILNNNGKIETMNTHIETNCNQTKFNIFGQTDVIDSYLTGIDMNFEMKLHMIIKNIFNPTIHQEKMLKNEINRLKTMTKLELLRNTYALPDDDLFEIMETLIKATELKRKLLPDIDSVGGNVHIEKITKNEGIEINEKIYKTIKR